MKRISVLYALCLFALVTSLVLSGCTGAATPAAAPTQAPAAAQPQAATQPPAPTEAAAPAAEPTQPPAAAAPTAAAPATAPTASAPTATPWAVTPGTIRLATTTSTYDTGLLDWLLPQYTQATGTKVDVVAVGTGQALAIGQRGDCDVVLVHARAQEDAFVKAGNAKERFDVMYNDFILVGPKDDPAKAATAADVKAAFMAIADTKSAFVSRGDKSGTNSKELAIWSSAKITPTKEMNWYNAIGQGMSDSLIFANEKGGYTLTDRGTWLATASKLPNLVIITGGKTLAENKDKTLLNPYGIMAVSPDKHPGVQYDAAMQFLNWFISADTMKKIATFGVDKYGQQLFYPDSEPYRASLSK